MAVGDLGLTATHGQDTWANFLIEALSAQSAVLQAGASRILIDGKTANVPRILVNPAATWTAELAPIASDAGNADNVVLRPEKVANLVSTSREALEDAPINEVDAIGRSMIRGVASAIETLFFSDDAAVAGTSPAGLLNFTLPASGAGAVDVTTILTGAGIVQAAGGNPTAIFLHPTDMTAMKIAAFTGGYDLADALAPTVPYVTPNLTAGNGIVCDPRFILFGIRRDARVNWSEHHLFGNDGVAARVTMRVDWAPSDPAAFYVLT